MKNKLKEKWNTSYHITFILDMLCIFITCGWLIWCVIHPRPNYIVIWFLLFYFDIRLYREMEIQNYIWRAEYQRSVKAWKKRKRQAAKQNENFKEQRPVPDRKIAREPFDYILLIPVCLWLVWIFTSPLNVLFNGRMCWEYERDIRELKEKKLDEVYFFPDELPESTKKVKWHVMPEFVWGISINECLYLECDAEYVREIVNRYKEQAVIYTYNSKEGYWGVNFPGRNYMEEGRETEYTVYMLYDDERDERQIYGFYVNEERGIICYFGY